jgi:chromosome segregation protein
VAHLSEELAGAREIVRVARLGMQAPLAERDTAAGRLAEARGAHAALQQEQAAIAALRESRRTALARLDDRIGARRREADARVAEIDAADAERLKNAAAQETLLARIAASEAAALQPRERATSLGRELAELEPLHESLRSRLAELERHSLSAENDVHRRAQDLDRLREEMLDEGFTFDEPVAEPMPAAGSGRPLVRSGDDLVPLVAPAVEAVGAPDTATLQEQVRSLRARIRNLGAVNPQAGDEYEEARERHDFLVTQVKDLREAEAGLQEMIGELRHTIREQFRDTFQRVNADFQNYFKTFFGGGAARLVLAEPEDYSESGVDIVARPPGKRLQSLTLLSGGERSMTAVALLFALLESNPAPFCVLDEVDAALDEANVSRFGEALRDLSKRSQFVVITHNRGTIESADTIYGVSMGTDGVSNVLSLRLADVPGGVAE